MEDAGRSTERSGVRSSRPARMEWKRRPSQTTVSDIRIYIVAACIGTGTGTAGARWRLKQQRRRWRDEETTRRGEAEVDQRGEGTRNAKRWCGRTSRIKKYQKSSYSFLFCFKFVYIIFWFFSRIFRFFSSGSEVAGPKYRARNAGSAVATPGAR